MKNKNPNFKVAPELLERAYHGDVKALLKIGKQALRNNIGHSAAEARALTFTTLVVANIGLIFANRSYTHVIFTSLRIKNKALWMVVIGTLFLLALVLYVPFLRNLFNFETLHFIDLLICLVAGFVSIIWFELIKLI